MTTDKKLTKHEQEALESYNKKLQKVRDMTRLVAGGFSNGYYCWGDGGCGKSFNIIAEFKAMGLVEGETWLLHNTRLSGPALGDSIEKFPSQPHLFEDIENIFIDPTSLNMARSAMWGQEDESGRQERIVLYGVKNPLKPGEERRIEFTGQMFFTANKPLEAIPELEALSTRIEVQHLEVERDEMLAIMKSICLPGKQTDKGFVSPEDCLEVFRYYSTHLFTDTKLNLRVLNRAIKLRLGVKKLKLTTTWQQFVDQAIKQSTESQQPLTRLQRISKERDIAIEVRRQGLTGKALQAEWEKRTGHPTFDSYYRRLK
jgi:hypothetical protein